MRKLYIWIYALSLLLTAPQVFAQGQVITTGAPNPKQFSGAPTGACGPQDTAVDTTTGNFYTCKSAAWQISSGGGPIGTGNPWVDVLTKGADPTGTNDNTTAFNAASTAVAAGGTIHVPCPLGTPCLYIFKTVNWGVTATANTRIIIDAGVVLQAQAGWSLNFPLLASASSVIDSGSITNAATYFLSTAGGIRLSPTSLGGVPSCAFTTGGGTSPSCALQTGSTDNVGTIILTTGTGSPGSSGTLTLTFSSAFGTNPPTCLMIGSGTGAGQWSARVSFLDNNASTTSDVQTWDNSGTVLSASTAYRVNYRCYPK